jgi:hypothetical protein
MRFSALGGNASCGHDLAQDMVNVYGSGGPAGYGSPLWQSPQGILDCFSGPDEKAKLRQFYGFGTGIGMASGATTWEWGMNAGEWELQGSATTYWQQALITQVQCP